jgi:hypothetical protein
MRESAAAGACERKKPDSFIGKALIQQKKSEPGLPSREVGRDMETA